MTRSSSSLDGANMPHAAVKAEPQQPDSLEEEDSELMGEDSEAEDDEGFETYQTAEMGELGETKISMEEWEKKTAMGRLRKVRNYFSIFG